MYVEKRGQNECVHDIYPIYVQAYMTVDVPCKASDDDEQKCTGYGLTVHPTLII